MSSHERPPAIRGISSFCRIFFFFGIPTRRKMKTLIKPSVLWQFMRCCFSLFGLVSVCYTAPTQNEGYYSSKLKQHAGAELEELSIEVDHSNSWIMCNGDGGGLLPI